MHLQDLEIAADFNITVTADELLEALKDTCHVQVVAPQSSGYLMFIPENISQNRKLILQFLNVTCGREDSSHTSPGKYIACEIFCSHEAHAFKTYFCWEETPCLMIRCSVKDEHVFDFKSTGMFQDICFLQYNLCAVNAGDEDGYLLLVKCGGAVDCRDQCPRWHGKKVYVDPTAETTIALSHIEVTNQTVDIHAKVKLQNLFQKLYGSVTSTLLVKISSYCVSFLFNLCMILCYCPDNLCFLFNYSLG